MLQPHDIAQGLIARGIFPLAVHPHQPKVDGRVDITNTVCVLVHSQATCVEVVSKAGDATISSGLRIGSTDSVLAAVVVDLLAIRGQIDGLTADGHIVEIKTVDHCARGHALEASARALYEHVSKTLP